MDNDVLNGLTAEVSREERTAADTAAEDRTDRLAARAARRMATRHAGCTGRQCAHRNHRRDVLHATLLIEALGKEGVPPPTKADYAGALSYHSVTKAEAANMRGSRPG